MSKFCPNCGNQLNDGETFCNQCGTNVAGDVNNANPQMQQQQPMQQPQPNNYNANQAFTTANIKKKDIVVPIILTILTCGIYGLFWFVQINDDANTANGEPGTSGGVALLLTIITCGIYGIYWYYKMGETIYKAGQKHGVNISNNSIIYIILGVFGLGLVNYCIMQTDLNKMANQ